MVQKAGSTGTQPGEELRVLGWEAWGGERQPDGHAGGRLQLRQLTCLVCFKWHPSPRVTTEDQASLRRPDSEPPGQNLGASGGIQFSRPQVDKMAGCAPECALSWYSFCSYWAGRVLKEGKSSGFGLWSEYSTNLDDLPRYWDCDGIESNRGDATFMQSEERHGKQHRKCQPSCALFILKPRSPSSCFP